MSRQPTPRRLRGLTVALIAPAVGVSMAACTSGKSGGSSTPQSRSTSISGTTQPGPGGSSTPAGASTGTPSSTGAPSSTGTPSRSAPATTEPTTLLDSAFVRRADKVCAAGNAYGKTHRFPVANFDPTNPSPAQLPKVARYLQAGPDVIGNLIALRPPTKGAADWRKIVVVLRQERLNQSAQTRAAKASDPQSFSHTAQDAGVIGRQLLAAARAHGLAPAGDCLTYFGG